MKKLSGINDEEILSHIYKIRNLRVMLDEDLADMYGVETRRLNEQVRRNANRFPPDFMFQLSEVEFDNLKSQNATSSWGGRRKLPMAFTEYGVLMLSSVLNNETAIQVNIRIMRIYSKMREILSVNKDILLKLESIEKKLISNDFRMDKQEGDLRTVFEALRVLILKPNEPRKRMGYLPDDLE